MRMAGMLRGLAVCLAMSVAGVMGVDTRVKVKMNPMHQGGSDMTLPGQMPDGSQDDTPGYPMEEGTGSGGFARLPDGSPPPPASRRLPVVNPAHGVKRTGADYATFKEAIDACHDPKKNAQHRQDAYFQAVAQCQKMDSNQLQDTYRDWRHAYDMGRAIFTLRHPRYQQPLRAYYREVLFNLAESEASLEGLEYAADQGDALASKSYYSIALALQALKQLGQVEAGVYRSVLVADDQALADVHDALVAKAFAFTTEQGEVRAATIAELKKAVYQYADVEFTVADPAWRPDNWHLRDFSGSEKLEAEVLNTVRMQLKSKHWAHVLSVAARVPKGERDACFSRLQLKSTAIPAVAAVECCRRYGADAGAMLRYSYALDAALAAEKKEKNASRTRKSRDRRFSLRDWAKVCGLSVPKDHLISEHYRLLIELDGLQDQLNVAKNNAHMPPVLHWGTGELDKRLSPEHHTVAQLQQRLDEAQQRLALHNALMDKAIAARRLKPEEADKLAAQCIAARLNEKNNASRTTASKVLAAILSNPSNPNIEGQIITKLLEQARKIGFRQDAVKFRSQRAYAYAASAGITLEVLGLGACIYLLASLAKYYYGSITLSDGTRISGKENEERVADLITQQSHQVGNAVAIEAEIEERLAHRPKRFRKRAFSVGTAVNGSIAGVLLGGILLTIWNVYCLHRWNVNGAFNERAKAANKMQWRDSSEHLAVASAGSAPAVV